MKHLFAYILLLIVVLSTLPGCMTAITIGNIKTKYTPADSLHEITTAYLDSNNVLLINFTGQSKMKKIREYRIKTDIEALHQHDAPNKKYKMLSKKTDRDINTINIELKRSVLRKGHKTLKTTNKELPICITDNNCIDKGSARESQKTSSFSLNFHHKNGKKYALTIANKTQHPHRWQAILLPLTVTADIITSPFQLIGFLVLKSDLKQ